MLFVEIKRARNLFPSLDDRGAETSTNSRSYATCTLLPDTSQRKTTITDYSSDPNWRESFTFDGVTAEEMVRERALEVCVWDCNHNDFIGGIRLGPAPGMMWNRDWMDSNGDEVAHWESVLAQPGEWVERWHTLRKNMTPVGTAINNDNLTHFTEANLDSEFRKVSPKSSKSGSSSDNTTTTRGETAKPAIESEFGKVPARRHHAHSKSSSPKLNGESHTTAADPKSVREMGKTGARTNGSSSFDNEFRKIAHKLSPSSSQEHLPQKLLAKTVGDVSGSSASLPHSVPPLTLDMVARSGDVRARTMSPEPVGPLKRAGLLGVKHGGSVSSLGSQVSIYSSAGGGKGNYDITGEILLGIRYNNAHI